MTIDVARQFWQASGNSWKERQLVDFPYARVEAALTTAYGVRARDLGAFRARLTFWQKGRVLGISPGKGKALRYTPDLMNRLIFSIELAECGATPAMVVGTVTDLWEKRIRRVFERAEDAATGLIPSPNDIIVELGNISLMIGGWDSTAKALPNVNYCELCKLPDHMAMWMNDSDARRAPRVVVINLSERLRRFHAALTATPESEQAQVPQTKATKGGARRRNRAG
jgi:hypothetical protein